MESSYTMDDDSLLDVSVTDVYDQAAGIGKEFEKHPGDIRVYTLRLGDTINVIR